MTRNYFFTLKYLINLYNTQSSPAERWYSYDLPGLTTWGFGPGTRQAPLYSVLHTYFRIDWLMKSDLKILLNKHDYVLYPVEVLQSQKRNYRCIKCWGPGPILTRRCASCGPLCPPSPPLAGG